MWNYLVTGLSYVVWQHTNGSHSPEGLQCSRATGHGWPSNEDPIVNAKQADTAIALAQSKRCAAGWLPYVDDDGVETFVVTVVETDTGRIVRFNDLDALQAWAGEVWHE